MAKQPSKRALILGHMRVAGCENDRKAWTRLYAENKISIAMAEEAWREGRAAAKGPIRCPQCEGGLDGSDLAYGLVCPSCSIRVAGPFADNDQVPDYTPVASRTRS